jgi:hypothetical protein
LLPSPVQARSEQAGGGVYNNNGSNRPLFQSLSPLLSGWALGLEGGRFRRGFYSVFIGERLGGVSRRRTGRVGLSGAGGRGLNGGGKGDVCQRLVGRWIEREGAFKLWNERRPTRAKARTFRLDQAGRLLTIGPRLCGASCMCRDAPD